MPRAPSTARRCTTDSSNRVQLEGEWLLAQHFVYLRYSRCAATVDEDGALGAAEQTPLRRRNVRGDR